MTDEYEEFTEQTTIPTAVFVLADIQGKLKAPKGQTNKFGNYKYRSCEDIVEAVKPLLAEHKATLLISDTVELIGDRYYIRASATVQVGTDSLTVQAYAREPAMQKGMSEAQLTGATSSYARKYALNGLFAIDDGKDADTQDNHASHNMDGTHIDTKALDALVDIAVEICDTIDAEPGELAHKAKELYQPLSNDQRQYFNGQMQARKFQNAETGRQVGYWRPFKTLLMEAAEESE